MKTALLSILFLLSFGGAHAATLVNINTAGAGELTTLKGIGPAKAQAIIDYREARPFRKIEDIMQVKGIGPATFSDIKNFITVGEVATPEPTPAAKVSAASVQTPQAQAAAPILAPTPPKDSTPLWWYLLGLAALTGLGVAASMYAKAIAPRLETSPSADEFEIE